MGTDWLEITADTTPDEIDGLSERLEAAGVTGLVIEDERQYEDFLESCRKYWDYVDEDFMNSVKGLCRVKFYLEDSPKGLRELERLRGELPDFELVCAHVRDEDWENNWKEYYKPIAVGERLMIVPSWEETPKSAGRTVLRLDPGLIFGTGAHATTRMCLEAAEKHSGAGKTVLDLGCGSGILAAAALLLGCDSAVGCDIDDKAPDVVMANAALNGIGPDRLGVFAGDVLADAAFAKRIGERKFDIVFANIVADVIIALAPAVPGFMAEGAVFICSGIIEGRQAEVERALKDAGFKITRRRAQDDWYCYECVYRRKTEMKKLKTIVLAAGKGTRLRTEGCDLPKVMRLADGRPLLSYVLDAVPTGPKDTVLVVGYMREKVTEAFPKYVPAVQEEQLGTGHACACGMAPLDGFEGSVLVCCGDMPLIKKDTYAAVCAEHERSGNACTMLTGVTDELLPYGRILRSESGEFIRVIEDKDCTPEQKKIRELNSGVYVFDAAALKDALGELKSDNAQHEYYLTDVPEIMMSKGLKVGLCKRDLGMEIIGVNTPEQLAEVERIIRQG